MCGLASSEWLQILMAKLLDPGPVLVLSFQAQQLTLKTRAGQERQVSRLASLSSDGVCVCRRSCWRVCTMCGLCVETRPSTTPSLPGRCWSLASQLLARC